MQHDGIFSAVPPELLHQYGLGMEKYCFDFTWTFIKVHYEREKEVKRENSKVQSKSTKRLKPAGGQTSVKRLRTSGDHHIKTEQDDGNKSCHYIKREDESYHKKEKDHRVGEKTYATVSQNRWTNELDRRIASFTSHHADLSMPSIRFPIGCYNLPYLQSKEYKALLYQACFPCYQHICIRLSLLLLLV